MTDETSGEGEAATAEEGLRVVEVESGEALEFLTFVSVQDAAQDASATWEVAHRRGGDSVAVLVYLQNAKAVMLQRRFRAGPAARDGAELSALEPFMLLETLAMALDAKRDRTPAACARRCVRERAGLDVTEDMMRHVSTYYVSPGASSERIHFYMVVAPAAPERAPEGVEIAPASLFLEAVEAERRALRPLDLKILVGAEELRRWLSFAEPTALPASLAREAER